MRRRRSPPTPGLSLSRVEPQPVTEHFLKGVSGFIQRSMGRTKRPKTSGWRSLSSAMSLRLERGS